MPGVFNRGLRMEVIDRLKEFYLLEVFQVQLYQSWISSAPDQYFQTVYEKLVQVEQAHVDYFGTMIKDKGSEIPIISGGLTWLAGKLCGEAIDLSKDENKYKMGIWAENKAMGMYRAFILEAWNQPQLAKNLYNQMVDEEHHLLWFKEYIKN